MFGRVVFCFLFFLFWRISRLENLVGKAFSFYNIVVLPLGMGFDVCVFLKCVNLEIPGRLASS